MKKNLVQNVIRLGIRRIQSGSSTPVNQAVSHVIVHGVDAGPVYRLLDAHILDHHVVGFFLVVLRSWSVVMRRPLVFARLAIFVVGQPDKQRVVLGRSYLVLVVVMVVVSSVVVTIFLGSTALGTSGYLGHATGALVVLVMGLRVWLLLEVGAS